MKIIVGMIIIYLGIIGIVLFSSVAEAALNNYGRVPNQVATYYHANGGPARNNSHGYLWGK